jgi:hypothetical protein
MAKYNYGKTFKHKNGKMIKYRYTNKKKSTKKLVAASSKKSTYRKRY